MSHNTEVSGDIGTVATGERRKKKALVPTLTHYPSLSLHIVSMMGET